MLTTTVSGALKERYRHFNFDLCSGAFSPEQPPGGRVLVPVQGHFGAAWMANGVTWFYERDRRPKRGDGRPMKAKAPRGFRPFLGAPAETMVVLVEGEGDYIAACSVGLKGAVCTGGTRALLGKGMRAAIARLVDGRDAYLLFDPDREGREYALQCARRIFACGRPLSVRIVELPADKDLEEFLAAFEDPGAARAALEELMAATPAVEAEDVEALLSGENLQRVHALQRRVRIPGSKVPALVVTVYDAERDRAQLAAFAPPECFESGNPWEEEDHPHYAPEPGPEDVEVGPHGWRLLDAWEFCGRLYLPHVLGDTQRALRNGRLVVPPAQLHEGADDAAQLWRDVRELYRRWAILPDARDYDVLTAFAFLTYRVHDAGFGFCPYIYVQGESGRGKGQVLGLSKLLCMAAYKSKPTAAGLHRFLDFHAEATPIMDEIHFDRMGRETQEALMDVLCRGYERGEASTRMMHQHRKPGSEDPDMVPRDFEVFGPKLMAGYRFTDEEGVRRRTYVIRTLPRDLEFGDKPEHLRGRFELPSEVMEEAQRLRARLLAWRGRELLKGRPADGTERAVRLDREVGAKVGQAWWPLLAIVPEGMDDVLGKLLEAARALREELENTVTQGPEARALQAAAEVARGRRALPLATARRRAVLVQLADVAAQLQEREPNVTVDQVKHRLAVLEYGRPQVVEDGKKRQRYGFVLELEEGGTTAAAMRRHGVEWPPEPLPAPAM